MTVPGQLQAQGSSQARPCLVLRMLLLPMPHNRHSSDSVEMR